MTELKDIIEATLYKSDGKPRHNLITQEKWMRNNRPDLLERILSETSWLPDDATLRERIYCLRHGIVERPKCPICHKDVSFAKTVTQYKVTCGDKRCLTEHNVIRNTGRKQSQETKDKRAAKHRGMKRPESFRKKMSVISKRLWEDNGYRKRVIETNRKRGNYKRHGDGENIVRNEAS